MSMQIRGKKKVDLGKPIKRIRFKLVCSDNLKNPDGSMNVDTIIFHGQALQDAKMILGNGNFILTHKNFIIPLSCDQSESMCPSKIKIDICEASNITGFSNLRKAMSKNIPLNMDSRVSVPHFHDRRVFCIGYDPETEHLFVF